MTYTQISKIIEEEDGKKISRQTISKIVRRFNETKSLAPKRKSGRKRKLTLDHHNFIDKCYENNDELTSVDVQKLVKSEFQLDVSSSCIRQARQKIGWTLTGPRYCQLVRVPNQVLRLEFCQKLLRTNEQFEDVIFTDESTIMMDNHGKICFRKKGRLPNLKPTAKHPYKIHVWAGISTSEDAHDQPRGTTEPEHDHPQSNTEQSDNNLFPVSSYEEYGLIDNAPTNHMTSINCQPEELLRHNIDFDVSKHY
ncbi:uncharacterized protein LOC130624292 [Hydractinia symbiolongicarpus]|uniref:uncharacterized protein LOC130624292 n=1 Tax=Hydractinia symbiolongicarpus TaxID=13093 RepID=UPI00254CB359|nr:uncharacterized protein LOC130624292 [Hydractinia symbiolongicarpus]